MRVEKYPQRSQTNSKLASKSNNPWDRYNSDRSAEFRFCVPIDTSVAQCLRTHLRLFYTRHSFGLSDSFEPGCWDSPPVSHLTTTIANRYEKRSVPPRQSLDPHAFKRHIAKTGSPHGFRENQPSSKTPKSSPIAPVGFARDAGGL